MQWIDTFVSGCTCGYGWGRLWVIVPILIDTTMGIVGNNWHNWNNWKNWNSWNNCQLKIKWRNREMVLQKRLSYLMKVFCGAPYIQGCRSRLGYSRNGGTMREKMSARHTNAAGKTTCHTHREHVRNTRTPPQSSTPPSVILKGTSIDIVLKWYMVMWRAEKHTCLSQ